MRDTIFRKEVVDAQGQRSFGPVLVQAPWQVSLLIYLLLAVFVAILLFLVFGSYHRKEKASGILRPAAGLVKVYPPRSGLIESLAVGEGDLATVGQILFRLGEDRVAAGGRDIVALQRPELENMHQRLLARQAALPAQRQREEANLIADIGRIQQRLESMRLQLRVTRERLDLKRQRLLRLEKLTADRAISQDEVDRNRDEILLLDSQWKSDQQSLLKEESSLQAMETRLSNLDLQFASEESQLLQELNDVKQRLLDLELLQSQEIRARISGRVTSIQGYPGMQVDRNRPVLTIIPEGGKMEAHLFVPTRAIGFLTPGQRVLLQYDAFPYQKYGVFEGTVKQVALSALAPHELADMDLSHLQEPLYRVIVNLPYQDITAFGKKVPLQSGMTLKADIILESRSLLQWLLEPLYRART